MADKLDQLILTHLPGGLIVTAADHTVLRWNDGAQRIFGYAAADAIGQPLWKLIAVNGETGAGDVEIPCRTKAGDIIYADIASAPMAEYMIYSVRDISRSITERKQIERALTQQKYELERANLAKDRFLTSISHELRTPLNAILGFSQLLGNDTLPSSEEQKRGFVQNIVTAGKHLLSLIEEILDLARIESGSMSVTLQPVPLAALLADAAAMVTQQAATRGVRMLYPECGTLTVRADPIRLRQIMLNLLSNAVKYNCRGGVAIVNVGPGDPGRLRISVQDTGAGLDAAQLDALFQPFNRLGQEAGAEEGAGIGLVVSKRFMELMHGAMGVRSTVGVGSVFWIELPVLETEPRQHDDAAAAPPPLPAGVEPATILYVEDNPASMKLIEDVIGFRRDLKLITAVDAPAGIALAISAQPRVILMDINLPGMSGREAKQALAADPRTAHIPVIALTANAMYADVRSAMAAGFFRYLTKPIDLDILYAAINDALAQQR
jgi:signal transduction histidine kinase/CheY-like chemotaxis protein